MFLAFGVVPHQWIDHADKNLGWTQGQASSIGPGGILKPQSHGGWNPFTLQYEAVRDIVVVAHPRRLLRADHLHLEWWQKRGDVKPRHCRSSTYGRPLVKKA